MIRLKTLLEQTTKKIPNVLFITDNIEDRRKGFVKQLITNSIVTGDIRTVDKGSLAQLKDALSVAISSYYDLVVVITRGIYELNKNSQYGLTILDTIKNICKTANIPLVFNTIPSVQFVKPKFAKQISFTLADDAEFDKFINQTADYVLDTSIFNDDSFFNTSGIYLTRQAHEILYNQMIDILNDLDDADQPTYDVGQTEKIVAEPGSKGRNVRVLQQQLIKFGYKLNKFELQNQKFGDSTAAALIAFKMKHGLNADAVLDKQTINKLKTSVRDKIGIDQTSDLDKIPTSKAKEKIQLTDGEIADAMNVMRFLIDKGLSIAGAAGIAGNMKIESNFKTAVLGDNGTSIGLIQWHMGRKDKLFSWAEENGYDPLSTNGQLEYLWWELTTSFSKLTSDLKIIEDPYAAAYQFAKECEVPAQISENRMDYAQEYFDKYNSSDGGGSSDSDSSLVGLLGQGLKGLLGIGLTGVIGTEIFGTGDGQLIGNKGGGDGGDWGGSLPKLISILPAGDWKAGSQKRVKKLSKSNNVSDHYDGKTNSYAGDFGLNSTFGGDKEKATQFAIAVAQNAGKDIDSWTPYIGKYLNIDSDGYRVQIIWQSMVGGNHYDHVHVGVRKR